MSFPIVNREFPVDPVGLLPAITPDNEQHWSALARGELVLQGCADCGCVRYPIAPVCSSCGSTAWDWKPLSGRGVIFSCVRFQRITTSTRTRIASPTSSPGVVCSVPMVINCGSCEIN